MKIYNLAKALLFANFLFVAPNCFAAPQIDCGVYQFSGVIQMNSQHMFVMPFARSIHLPAEILILTDKSEGLLERMGRYTTFEAQVERPILNNDQPFVYLRKIIKTDNTPEGRFKKISSLKCK